MEEYAAPPEPSLGPVYPNPFSQSTIIQYSVSSGNGEPVPVRIEVYNSTGQLVKNLVEMKLPAGNYAVEWDGRYKDERLVSDGIYYVRMMAGTAQFVEKAVVIR
jgi:flagellar hook assembly protein FlgD